MAVLTLLAVDGVLCAIAAAFFLRIYIGSVPFPVSALIAGLVNAALVWAALQWSSSATWAALPIWTWLATIATLVFLEPGGSVVFGGVRIMDYALALLLLVVGLVPPVLVLRRHISA